MLVHFLVVFTPDLTRTKPKNYYDMVEPTCADSLNVPQDIIAEITYKAKYTPKMYQSHADSVEKNQKPSTIYLMNVPVSNKPALTYYTTNPS